jgi:acetylornithine/N-succinyldiaminopimelate aminotransferase
MTSWSDRDAARIFHTYKRYPLEIERGDGMYLHATDGSRYLDMFAGVAVSALGHGHPRVINAVVQQARRYMHVSNYYLQEPQLKLAELLTASSGYGKVFFANTGAEVVEGAIKITRRWGSSRGKSGLVAFANAFHGRTMGALSLMDRPKYREGFGPFLDRCRILPFNDVKALEEGVDEATAGVVLEFVQGEGGLRPVTQEFVSALRQLREKHGFLIVADEIQCGLGRTGKFFGFEHYEIVPDIVLVAKPLGGGLPLAAILANDDIASVLQPGMHGTTFGGNPVACAAGVVVVEELLQNGIMENARRMGELFVTRLKELQSRMPHTIREVRGLGLMVGVELAMDGNPVVDAMREQKVIINCTDQTVLRIVPPLIVAEEHIDTTVRALEDVLQALPATVAVAGKQ